MGNLTSIVLDIDHLIQLSILAAYSYWFNPRNFEYPHRQTAELIAWKLALELSPCHRCTVTTEFSFWPWEEDEEDQADDIPALLLDGQLEGDAGAANVADIDGDIEMTNASADLSLLSNTSTLKLGNVRYRACDVAVFYQHLPSFLPMLGLHMLASLMPSSRNPKFPLVLIEVKRSASRRLATAERKTALLNLLEAAKTQLGEQAGFMFGNRRFRQQPYVIGIAMTAEVWSYAIFHRDLRPGDFDSTEEWLLPRELWSRPLHWGTPRSNQGFNIVKQVAEALLVAMGIARV